MAEQTQRIDSIREGLIAGLPIVFGYLPVAMAFGLLSKNTGISFRDSCLFSIVVFAGASQFMALDLIRTSIAVGNIILATFLLNLRHLMMSASLSVRLKDIRKHWLIFIAFGVTDETFSVTSLGNKNLNVPFLVALHTIAYCSWILGTIVGYLLGEVLPIAVQSSLGIGLYAMFTALLVPEMKKSSPILILSILSGAIYAILALISILPASWNLIVAIVLGAGMGVFLFKEDMEEASIE